MLIRNYWILMLAAVILSSCSRSPVAVPGAPPKSGPPGDAVQVDAEDGSEVEYSYYPNGRIEYEIWYRYGQLHGPSKHWSPEGILRSDAEYRHGLLEGLARTYDDGGHLLAETQYKSGMKCGFERWYHPDGQIKSEAVYQDGLQVGVMRRWDADGRELP